MYHTSPALILLGQMGFGLIIGLYSGTQATTMVESTPPQIRCTAVALGYNACVGVIGGLSWRAGWWGVPRMSLLQPI